MFQDHNISPKSTFSCHLRPPLLTDDLLGQNIFFLLYLQNPLPPPLVRDGRLTDKPLSIVDVVVVVVVYDDDVVVDH